MVRRQAGPRALIFLILLLLAVLPCLYGQDEDELLQEDLDLDSLFEEDSDFQDLSEEDVQAALPEEQPQEKTGSASTDKEVDLLNDVIRKSAFSLGGNFRFVAGYSSGWSYMPWNPGINQSRGMDDMAVMDMRSALTLNFQIGPEFRVLQKYTLSFPELETQVGEFFCDYSVKERVYMRIGRQNLTWGISRNFPFTNLTARIPEDFGDRSNDNYLTDADSYAFKLNIPVSIGGIEGLVFTRNGFFEDPHAPAADEIGYGGTVNLANTKFDLTMGTFYHAQMNWRNFYSLSTTLFRNIEIYQEGLISYDIQNDDISPDMNSRFRELDQTYQYPVSLKEYTWNPLPSDRWDFSLNLGFYVDLFDRKLKLSGEYFYCGEETELDVKNTTFPLLWGHNVAAGISWKTARNKLNFFTQVKYNKMEDSGIVIPGLTLDAIPYLTLNLAVPVIWGASDGGYNVNNPDNQDRPVSFILTAVVSGKI